MFFAALMSRSCRAPQDGHLQCLVDRLSSASKRPQALHLYAVLTNTGSYM